MKNINDKYFNLINTYHFKINMSTSKTRKIKFNIKFH